MSPEIEIRLAKASDLDALQARQESRESDYPWPYLIQRWVENREFWVADHKGEIVGWISLEYRFFEEGFIGILWVEEPYRRQGLGSSLMLKAREICSTDRLWTSTNQSNEPMQKLLDRLGWEYSGTIKHLDLDDPELIYCHVCKETS